MNRDLVEQAQAAATAAHAALNDAIMADRDGDTAEAYEYLLVGLSKYADVIQMLTRAIAKDDALVLECECECRKILGEACTSTGDRFVLLEWVPRYRRGTAETIGSWQGLTEVVCVLEACARFCMADPWVRNIRRRKS